MRSLFQVGHGDPSLSFTNVADVGLRIGFQLKKDTLLIAQCDDVILAKRKIDVADYCRGNFPSLACENLNLVVTSNKLIVSLVYGQNKVVIR